jgi:hypothetical protein
MNLLGKSQPTFDASGISGADLRARAGAHRTRNVLGKTYPRGNPGEFLDPTEVEYRNISKTGCKNSLMASDGNVKPRKNESNL